MCIQYFGGNELHTDIVGVYFVSTLAGNANQQIILSVEL